jgi:hypothetical protein
MTLRSSVRAGVALFTVLLAATATEAQNATTVTITGIVTDPQGAPVPDLHVLLHRVAGAGGASLGSALTDSTGAFSISAEAVSDTSAIYFAAARLDGELYIGPFVSEPDGSTPYVLVVGGDAVPIGPAMNPPLPPVSPGGGPRRQLLVILPLLALLGVATWAIMRGVRPPPERRALVRLAMIDEELAGSGDAQLERERVRLMEQLLAD